VVGKKKSTKGGGAGGASSTQDKDPDGSVRVPTYRGVWVNNAGKHFIKFQGKRFSEGGETLLFDTIDDAARKYDELVKSKGGDQGAELNYRDDGTRITHKEATSSSAVRGVEMLGGAADNVVPALSVINIKVSLSSANVLLPIAQLMIVKILRRICLPTSSLFFETRGKRRAPEGTPRGMFTLIEACVARRGRGTTDGKVKFPLWVSIIIWGRLILSGMPLLSTVRLIIAELSCRTELTSFVQRGLT
jgi:hypothetical protein